MNKKQLAIKLSRLKGFKEPKLQLEQYLLDSEIAAELLWNAYLNGDIKGKIVVDLGAGTGILGYGALLLGAKRVYFIEKDKDVIGVAKKNVKSKKAVFVNTDVDKFYIKVDTVIQNPPFGTKNKHADRVFLEKAMQLSEHIYSLHKLTSKRFIKNLIKGRFIINIKEVEIPLKKSYGFHKSRIYYVNAGIWMLTRNRKF